MRENYIQIGGLSVAKVLSDFINNELFKDIEINLSQFWIGFEKTINELTPKNRELLEIRETLQQEIDIWHKKNKSKQFNVNEYKKFLNEIGYLRKVGSDFKITTKNIDDEISSIAGPQLVVPIMNARYSLNAANARWMSLYDSLYGTDIIESEETGSEKYDPLRGEQVIKYGRNFLNEFFKIKDLDWRLITKLQIKNGKLLILKDKDVYNLVDEEKFIGHRGEATNPSAVILKNNNLHVEIIINPNAFSAKADLAGISDIILESAITTICDHEDSVAAVDASDKVLGYRNWLNLMNGSLVTNFEKNGKKLIRKLNTDRSYISKDGSKLKLKGRSLLLNRNVGHLMTNPAILLRDGSEAPEGIMDAFITTLCSLHDFKKK